MNKEQQSAADTAEIKIKPISNGWILKTKSAGWAAFTEIEPLLESVRAEAVRVRADYLVFLRRGQALDGARKVSYNTMKQAQGGDR